MGGETMKVRYEFFSFLSILFVLISGIYAEEKPLAEIYKLGKVRFVQEFVISDESLPEGEFFSGITSIAVDNSGSVYVCDVDANNIRKFNAKGEFLKTIGKEGQGPGDFNRPLKIEIVQDRLVVWESGNMRISILNLDGDFIKSIPYNFTELGWLYEIKALPNEKMIFENQVSFRRGPSRPWECYLRLFSYDLEHIKDLYEKEFWTRKNITEPRRQSIPIPFSARVHWDVTPKGNIVIGFSESYNIEIYDPLKGKISFFEHEYEPVEVIKEDKELFFAGMIVTTSSGGTRETKQGAPDYIVKNTEFPKYKPAFDDIKCDSESNIWVHKFCKDRKEENRSFDVFSEDGHFINSVRIEGERLYPRGVKIRNRSFCIVEADKDGYQKIVKYRISE